jgi:hypothetical protein
MCVSRMTISPTIVALYNIIHGPAKCGLAIYHVNIIFDECLKFQLGCGCNCPFIESSSEQCVIFVLENTRVGLSVWPTIGMNRTYCVPHSRCRDPCVDYWHKYMAVERVYLINLLGRTKLT